MRKAPGKKYGYIIIPVIVPSNVEADKALDSNERFRVVWTVLNALRAHDDRFNAIVNKIELNKQRPSQILMTRPDTAPATEYGEHPNDKNQTAAEREESYQRVQDEINQQLALQFEELQGVVFAKLVKKVGDRRYWEQWAKDVAIIAERYIERINLLITKDSTYKEVFHNFLTGLRKNINPAISESQAIEMLAQHIITKPVFDALFEGYSFVENNAISVAMQQMVTLLEEQTIDKDTETLDRFYDSVRKRASGIDNAEGKQRIIIELYDKFFKTAFPKMVEQLGIVYTPVEVVDFIIHSVNDVLKKEFDRSISDENVHVLDPFTGTGTFVTRLIQSGLIKPEDLPRKYKHELHANELVLLAYYIAAVNIENAYHDAISSSLPVGAAGVPEGQEGVLKSEVVTERSRSAAYESFDGICLTDTFQLGEADGSDEIFSDVFPKNSKRVELQKQAPLRVIMGNPPYSVGQKSANDNAQNQTYKELDARIANTYAKASTAGLNKSLYDAYIKAFRWSTDRLDPVNGGIIAFVSNGAWVETNGMDGFRKALEAEFDSIYVFDLRGNQRTSGELSRKEGGKIFGSGSRTPIAVTLLVKNPLSKAAKAKIHYHDIGDYLSQSEKLGIIQKFGSVLKPNMKWKTLMPNDEGDWLNQRSDIFGSLLEINAVKKYDTKSKSIFLTHSLGTATSRDAWVYNFSLSKLCKNIDKTVSFFNEQRKGFANQRDREDNLPFTEYISNDTTLISWNDSLRNLCEKNVALSVNLDMLRTGLYRPFCKSNLYFEKSLIQRPYQIPKIFPTQLLPNLVICVSGVGANKGFTALITNLIPSLDTVEKSQCFPLYYYEEQEQQGLFNQSGGEEYIRRDGVSEYILNRAKKQYGIAAGANTLTKEDVFYYVYGFLHSPTYRTAFANDLKKMLPRLPLVDDVRDFYKFSNAGRKLADLHINYETVPAYEGPGFEVRGAAESRTLIPESDGLYKVQKMRFPKKGQQDTIIYNSKITISGIPETAYEYVVNGKSAIHWIMERYQVKTDKNSGIKNDPNDWAAETGNPRYILDLLLSVINVSVQTVDIVKGLPEVEFE
jgi:predicted helicase